MASLNLANQMLTSLATYLFPPNLESLNLDNNNLTDLTGIPSTVKFLTVNNNPSLTSLAGCPNLETLLAQNCALTNLNDIPLSIVYFSAKNNNINDITALVNCLRLQKLELDNNLISDISPIPSNVSFFTVSNNNIETIPSTLGVYYLSIKNNPINYIGLLPKNLTELNITGCPITDLSTIITSYLKVVKTDYRTNNFSNWAPGIYEVDVGGEDMDSTIHVASFANVFLADTPLYTLPPTFSTISTTAGVWTQIPLSSYSTKGSFNFKVTNNNVYYFGNKLQQFVINGCMIVSGSTDTIQIVGTKNVSNTALIARGNSLITSGIISDRSVNLALNMSFFLNTGGYLSFYIRTLTDNVLTIYTFSALIIAITDTSGCC